MLEASHYLLLKHGHMALAATSVALFAARGAGVWAGRAWPMAAGVRRASVGIDMLLLAAGVALWVLMQYHPLRQAWLGLKLALLLAYIVLGSVALKRGRTRTVRSAALAAALACVATMAALAWAKPALWAAPAG